MCLDNGNVRICGVYMTVGHLHELNPPYKSIYIYSWFDWRVFTTKGHILDRVTFNFIVKKFVK
jgi:hypothetical protein